MMFPKTNKTRLDVTHPTSNRDHQMPHTKGRNPFRFIHHKFLNG
uniref:Uncharacterized protein n=1 Tax=Rhizophora mucronata TaxID=61149 RepID=A0A2P2ND14_RHIMU